jgi:translation initiation factor 2 alpha subunit (eIF-2alpha)
LKYVKWIAIPVLLLIGIGVIAYQVGTAFVADQVVKHVSLHLEENGELSRMLEEVKSSPELENIMLEVEGVNEEALPFTTKEEATKVLLKKFKVEELIDIQSMALDGISIEDEGALLSMFEEKLTEEELLALKVITVKELSK